VTVEDAAGMPEEQGFLRDVQAAACQQFNTVLAPGSNVYHYDTSTSIDAPRQPAHHLRAGRCLREEIAARQVGAIPMQLRAAVW